MSRFEVHDMRDAQKFANGELFVPTYTDAYGSILVDTETNTIVYCDSGNEEYPEDMTLTRDLSTFVVLLNEVAENAVG